jgi:thiol-disulfide isomerase/thioredoxin
MLRFIAGLLLVGTALCQPAPRRASEFVIHRTGAPDLKLSAYRGKVVVLAFLNTGCSHCQHFAQELAEYQKDYGPKGVQVLSVVFDKGAKEQLAGFRDKYVHGFPVGYSDEATVMDWLAQPLDQGYFVPIVAFVNRQGLVVSQHMGDDNLFQDPDANIRHVLDRLSIRR